MSLIWGFRADTGGTGLISDEGVGMPRRLGALFATIALALSFAGPAHAAGPTNTTPPMIYGTTIVGQSVSVTAGTWSSTPSSFSYQWFRCADAAQVSCEAIVGATAATYALGADSAGKYFKVSVTAITAGGGTTIQTALSIIVSLTAAATVPPVVSGELLRDSTLTTTSGTWNLTNTGFAYQWSRCTLATAGDCAAISGATSATYKLTTEDIGAFLKSTVTAIPTTAGYVIGTSNSTSYGPVLSQPVQVGTTTLIGSALEGETLTVSLGRIFGSPAATTTYAWQKCGSPSITTCTTIAGETSNSLYIAQSMNGNYLRVVPTIQNDLGGVIVPSASIGPITRPTGPSNSIAPSIIGEANIDTAVTGYSGIWAGTPAPTFTTSWMKCTSADVATCVDIAGETGTSLSLKISDLGKRIAFKVTGKNRVATTAVISGVSAPIDYRAKLVSAPMILGFGLVGMKLTTIAPAWSESLNVPLLYQWQRCTKSDASTCIDIPMALESSYTLVQSDQDKFIRVSVMAGDKTARAYSVLGKDAVYAGADSPAVVNPAPVVPKPVTKPVAKPVVKATTITCVKGTLSKKVKAVSPKCPTGYKKK